MLKKIEGILTEETAVRGAALLTEYKAVKSTRIEKVGDTFTILVSTFSAEEK